MRSIGTILLLGVTLSAAAQATDPKVQMAFENVKTQFVDFDTEHMLDSLDQEKLPRLVSGGVLAGVNMSNFIITRNHKPMSSHMRVGGELGGFLDFSLSKHFAVQPQVIFTAQQNYFAATDTTNHLWSFGVDIPIYFLGRFGNLQKGYIQFGGGIFTHFTFASNVANKYRNVDEETPTPTPTDPSVVVYDYSKLYTLHDNHFGVCVTVGYECTFGLQINAQYKVSLSDIAGFYSEMKGTEVANALIYPQSISLVFGYRWK
jgi:hypothetical protein